MFILYNRQMSLRPNANEFLYKTLSIEEVRMSNLKNHLFLVDKEESLTFVTPERKYMLPLCLLIIDGQYN